MTAPTRRPAARIWRAAVPRLSQFALEHLLLLPLGALIALVWVNTRAGELLPLHLRDRVRRQRRRHGVLLRADDQGSGRSDRAGRRAPSVAARAAAGDRGDRRDGRCAGAPPRPGWSRLLDEPMLASRWPVAFATDLALGYFVARIIFGGGIRSFRSCSCSAIASDALGFVALAVSEPGATFISSWPAC